MPAPEGSPETATALDAQRRSWERNADAWSVAVRDGRIPSRRAGTDDAILSACRRALGGLPGRVLDAGCGEGWLSRALADDGADVLGIDASEALVSRARMTAAGRTRFERVAYHHLGADSGVAAGPFDLIACNFALLDEDLSAPLGALAARLDRAGTLVVQTVHPIAAGPPYADGWRVERWEGFDVSFPEPMPWYFRTLGSWLAALRPAGLTLDRIDEPLHPDTGLPLSLLLECHRAN